MSASPEPSLAPDGRIVLLVVSPRVAPGQLTWPAWQGLREADTVLAAALDDDWWEALTGAGVEPVVAAETLPGSRARLLLDAAGPGRTAVWLGSPDGDPGLTDALAELLSHRAIDGLPPEVELLTGSHDVPGARLLDLVAVMDRLRSPGGCPWDARQTHVSLLPYLLEESHEVMEAVETGDRDHLREELGDLLLQVVFHARIAQEDERAPFGIDDVAAGIVTKLVRRHPHVFAGGSATDADQVAANWEELKVAEKRRTGLYEGIPPTLPALARAAKMLDRLARSSGGSVDPRALGRAAGDDELAAELLAVVERARAGDRDPEAALRAALTRLAAD
ncbi:MAG: MazG family protein [Kineosporiaceae bacterium]